MPTAELVIVGAGGVLGAKLVEQALARTDGPILACTHGATPAIPARESARVIWQALDISDGAAVRAAIASAQPRVVINAAAMTNVDACETRRAEALAANAGGPRHLAEACVAAGARLLHVSTDYVFPGGDEQPGPYLEDAPTRTVNYYGQTKLEGERAVAATCAGRASWLVARTALLYGHVPGGRTNFVKFVVGELRAGRRIKVVSDQWNTPTLADDLAAALLSLAGTTSEGIIHLAGPELLSRQQWAEAIAAHYALDTSLIDVTTTAALNQVAARPLRSGLRTRRAAELGGLTFRDARDGMDALEIA
ncbi:MAG TPA: SDR family oxidoreductase [Ktedonobacterales bacterium]|nr:SDR family oxidoreductase [Ktedonobacterales bacterium]